MARIAPLSPVRPSYRTILSITLLTCLVVPRSPAQKAQQVAQSTFPSVVLLVMEDENAEPISLGSGFFVRDGVVATNLHVIEKAARGYAKLVGHGSYRIPEGFAGSH
jgi:S1-C subfamily serine protease